MAWDRDALLSGSQAVDIAVLRPKPDYAVSAGLSNTKQSDHHMIALLVFGSLVL
jgi:hypothetical protein